MYRWLKENVRPKVFWLFASHMNSSSLLFRKSFKRQCLLSHLISPFTERIRQAIEYVDKENFKKVWENIRTRIDITVRDSGGHIQQEYMGIEIGVNIIQSTYPFFLN